MSDHEYDEGENGYEEGEVEEGQQLGFEDEEHPEGEEEEEPAPADPDADAAEHAPSEPEEEPLPPKKPWEGFIRIKLPSATAPKAPLRPARVYFPTEEAPAWTRYLLTDDVPYLEAVLMGKDVSDPQPEEEDGDGEEGAEGYEGEGEEGEEGAGEGEEGGEYDPDEEGGDDEEGGNSHATNRRIRRKGGNQRKGGRSNGGDGDGGGGSGDGSGGASVPVEFDEDGCLVIPDPLKGGVRFFFHQIFSSQGPDRDAGLPEIIVDDDEEELVFVASVMDKEAVEAEDAAFLEANGLPASGDGRGGMGGEEDAPSVGPAKAPNLRALIMTIPPEPEPAEEGEEDGEGEEGAGEDVDHTASPTHSNNNNGGEDGGDDGARALASTVASGGAATDATSEGLHGPAAPPLEFRMDALTLAALFCSNAVRRMLMRRELPATRLLEGWLEVYALPAEGTAEQTTEELSTMLTNICTGVTESIELKKNPPPLPHPLVDEDGNEIPHPVDLKHPPPPPIFITANENGTIAVPKLRMDLRWTFALEKELPTLTAAMRYVRSRLVGTARIAPAHPDASTLTTPPLLESYLEFLMTVPRSSLAAWIKPKLPEGEDNEDEIADMEGIMPEPEEHRLQPLSAMLGNILLDLRTREARKKSAKKDLKLSAFAAHKAVMCSRFLERGTILDPLLVPAYAAKGEGFADDLNPLHATVFGITTTRSVSPNASALESSESPTKAGAGAAVEKAPWPASLRLYDSDLVALALARYGSLESFREILSRKNNTNVIKRALDDTVGTYHLLLHALPRLERRCAVCLIEFVAVEVKSIPIFTKRSIVPPRECIEDVFAAVDKDDAYPSLIAAHFWQQLGRDRAWREAARIGCPSLLMRVQDEEVRMQALIEAITGIATGRKMSSSYPSSSPPTSPSYSHSSSTAAPSTKPLADGDYVIGQYTKGLMLQRDVLSPSVLHHAITSRNVSVIVALATRGVVTVRRPQHTTEQSLIDALLEDDTRRREARAAMPVAVRPAEDLLATEDEVSDGILSILTALVEAGMSLQGVLAAGRSDVASELLSRYGKCKKYKQLIKLWQTKESERNTDPTTRYGLLKYLPTERPPRLGIVAGGNAAAAEASKPTVAA